MRAGFRNMSCVDLISMIISMIFTIISGLVAGVSGILVARYSEKRRREAEYFHDIKQRCLEPVLREIQNFGLPDLPLGRFI
jgi:heme/copper-type cytochrome/quinol oxidase subunit 2